MNNHCGRRDGTVRVQYRSLARKHSGTYPYKCVLCGRFHISSEKPNFVVEHVPSAAKLKRQLDNSARIIAKQQKALDAVISKQKAQQAERDAEIAAITAMFINQHQSNRRP
jgi:hypothetical protein